MRLTQILRRSIFLNKEYLHIPNSENLWTRYIEVLKIEELVCNERMKDINAD